ncbi:hypothetical protein HPB49_018047 [Dermacentor silvarum]|uniref:Uncharacterized protein n=1 Tax=Dermacentor silvarum TaxID=543639 RepID=A0ACB8CYS0_DERSI|nr:hypothetical protein HPB49_018047 [Dermacentor silvarum]
MAGTIVDVIRQALFHLDKYDKAKEALEEGSLLDGADSEFAVWIEKCKEEIKLLEKAKETVVVPPAPAKIRHEWYQTESHVTITILLKNQKPEDIKTDFTDTTASKLSLWFVADYTSPSLNPMMQVESGGTVLSTNWEEISSKTTPVKPPDGMEYRKWTE